MSQNRVEARDRLRAENDYKVNLKAELEIRHLHEKIDHLLRRQYNRLFEIQQIQIELLEEIGRKRESWAGLRLVGPSKFPLKRGCRDSSVTRSEFAAGRMRLIGGLDRHYASPIHAATRTNIDIDSYRLRRGAKRAATGGGDGATRAIARDRGRRQWQNAHTHLPGSVLARERDRSAKYLAAHVHE